MKTKDVRPAKARVVVSVGESVRIVRELQGLTQSELFTIMTSGMAHVSGAVMAAYVLIAHVEIRQWTWGVNNPANG